MNRSDRGDPDSGRGMSMEVDGGVNEVGDLVEVTGLVREKVLMMGKMLELIDRNPQPEHFREIYRASNDVMKGIRRLLPNDTEMLSANENSIPVLPSFQHVVNSALGEPLPPMSLYPPHQQRVYQQQQQFRSSYPSSPSSSPLGMNHALQTPRLSHSPQSSPQASPQSPAQSSPLSTHLGYPMTLSPQSHSPTPHSPLSLDLSPQGNFANPNNDHNPQREKPRVKVHRTTGSAPVLSNNSVSDQASPMGFSASYNTNMFLEPVVQTPRPSHMGTNLAQVQENPRTQSTTPNGPKKCSFCKTESTPEWRRGPTGPKSLCNACGLRYSRRQKSIQGAEEDKS